jgi:hypothetical protein
VRPWQSMLLSKGVNVGRSSLGLLHRLVTSKMGTCVWKLYLPNGTLWRETSKRSIEIIDHIDSYLEARISNVTKAHRSTSPIKISDLCLNPALFPVSKGLKKSGSTGSHPLMHHYYKLFCREPSAGRSEPG